MSSKLTRLGIAAVGVSLLHTGVAFGQGAVIMTSLICQDPRDSIDTLWTDRRYGARDVYFMSDNGDVNPMDAQTALDDLDAIYVVSHGSSESVGDIAKADFAEFLHDAHPSTPASVYFDSCSTAVGVNTVLALTDAQYNNEVDALYGPQGPCQLVGNGNPAVEDAENRYDAGQAPGNQSVVVAGNIMNVWQNEEYVDSGETWEAACAGYVAGGDFASLNTWRLAVQDKFLTAPRDPVADSHNYGWLIEWNIDGLPFFQCGLSNGVACP